MTEASHPLSWPHLWPRHRGQQDSDARFKGPKYQWDRVYRELVDELRRIGATDIKVSTNQPVRADGLPYAQQRNITDTGVAVYFTRGKRQMVMAQDRFWSVIGNMRSLTMAIEGLRQMERHGGATMMERAFDGFLLLAPPEDCWDILGIQPELGHHNSRDRIMRAFRERAREGHGIGADMDRLVKARDEALAMLK